MEIANFFAMSFLDLAIIYFACGAPFGVYYYLTNRFRRTQVPNWLKSIGAGLLWIPFSLQLLTYWVNTRLNFPEVFENSSAAPEEKAISDAKKHFERFLPIDSQSLSVFELREVIERYCGLSFALKHEGSGPTQSEKELFRISNNQFSEISAVCLKRRNRKKLLAHQTTSRGDFLDVIEQLATLDNEKNLGRHVVEFVKLIEDDEALALIKPLLDNSSQTNHIKSVKELEKVLWKEDIPTQQIDPQTQLHLRALTATANSPIKD